MALKMTSLNTEFLENGFLIKRESLRFAFLPFWRRKNMKNVRRGEGSYHDACGRAALENLQHLVNKQQVTCILLTQDRYGRYVGRCFIAISALTADEKDAAQALLSAYITENGLDLAAWQILTGHAVADSSRSKFYDAIL